MLPSGAPIGEYYQRELIDPLSPYHPQLGCWDPRSTTMLQAGSSVIIFGGSLQPLASAWLSSRLPATDRARTALLELRGSPSYRSLERGCHTLASEASTRFLRLLRAALEAPDGRRKSIARNDQPKEGLTSQSCISCSATRFLHGLGVPDQRPELSKASSILRQQLP